MVTVIVCTYNRAGLLPRLVEVLSAQQPPAGRKVELLFVDNNSPDETRPVLERLAAGSRYPLRVVTETRQGLSHARNRGLDEARGEWLIFLDDDAIPREGWLRHMVEEIEGLGCLAGGGAVDPDWLPETPRWIARSGRYARPRLFASYDLGPAPLRLSEEQPTPFGGNMIFHRSLPAEALRFSPDLGTVAGSGGGGEESDVFNRLRALGHDLAYLGGARVLHPIDLRRARLKHVLPFMWKAGYSGAVVEARTSDPDPRPPLRRLLSRLRLAARALGDGLLHLDSLPLFWAACELASALGAYRARRDAGHRAERTVPVTGDGPPLPPGGGLGRG
jgi:glycosyltransferase involved in cell wall biosynthesis